MWLRKPVVIALFLTVLLVAGTQVAFAQDGGNEAACNQFLSNVADALVVNCSSMEEDNNSICYGFETLTARFANDQGALASPGASEDLTNLQYVGGSAFNLAAQDWGVAVINVEAFVDEYPDGYVETAMLRMMLLGDVEIEAAAAPALDSSGNVIINRNNPAPLQNIFLRTGAAATGCSRAPAPVLVVENPYLRAITLTVNGQDIMIYPQSTIMLRNNDLYGDYSARFMRMFVMRGQAEWGGVVIPPAHFSDVCLADPADLGIDSNAANPANDQLVSCPPTSPQPMDGDQVIEFTFIEETVITIEIPGIIQRSGIGEPEFEFRFETRERQIQLSCANGLLPAEVCSRLGVEVCVEPEDLALTCEVDATIGPDGFPVMNEDATQLCNGQLVCGDPIPLINVGGPVCSDFMVYHSNQDSPMDVWRTSGGPTEGMNLTLQGNEQFINFKPTLSADGQYIIYPSNASGYWELWAVATDGNGAPFQMTHWGNSVQSDPDWSERGVLLAFQTTINGNWDISVINLRLGLEYQLTADRGADLNPSWSPNHRYLVFQSDRDGIWQVYIRDNVTGTVRRLSDGTADDIDPKFSHDGTMIAFLSRRDGGSNAVLYVMDMNGNNVQRLSDVDGNVTAFAWAPDDSWIAYDSDLDGDQDIYGYEFASEETRLVTLNDVDDYSPTFFCDSLTVVFTSEETSEPGVAGVPNVFSTSLPPVDADAIVVMDEAGQVALSDSLDANPEGDRDEDGSNNSTLSRQPKR